MGLELLLNDTQALPAVPMELACIAACASLLCISGHESWDFSCHDEPAAHQTHLDILAVDLLGMSPSMCRQRGAAWQTQLVKSGSRQLPRW